MTESVIVPVRELMDWAGWADDAGAHHLFAKIQGFTSRAIAAKRLLGFNPITLVRTSDRLPTVGDGDPFGFLLAFSPLSNAWQLARFYEVNCQEHSHWLDYCLLPKPTTGLRKPEESEVAPEESEVAEE